MRRRGPQIYTQLSKIGSKRKIKTHDFVPLWGTLQITLLVRPFLLKFFYHYLLLLYSSFLSIFHSNLFAFSHPFHIAISRGSFITISMLSRFSTTIVLNYPNIQLTVFKIVPSMHAHAVALMHKSIFHCLHLYYIWTLVCHYFFQIIRATSNTRLRARDHYTSSTLIGGKRRSLSKFALHYAWGTNGVCECKMDVSSTWNPTWHQIGHLDCFPKQPLRGRPNTKPGDHGTPNVHNRWFILF